MQPTKTTKVINVDNEKHAQGVGEGYQVRPEFSSGGGLDKGEYLR
jgi:hypothetical protein